MLDEDIIKQIDLPEEKLKRFLKDVEAEGSEKLKEAVIKNPQLSQAWNLLDEGGLENLRKNTDLLETTSKYTNGTLTRKFEQFGLSLNEEAIIRHYTGPSHTQLNQALEGFGDLTPELTEYKNLLNQALRKLPDYKGVVYRGLGQAESTVAKTWQVGQDVTFNSFKSTSRSLDEADDFLFNNGGDVSLIINSKTGKAIDQVSFDAVELEVLFESGKKFKVDQVTFRQRFLESDPLIKEITLTEL
jgi:hypothetical protein